mmetsp:Transcript_63968/g.181673  ORF Transcript_63968/g.181673 Transcript_63968/m.181673 type:complete len:573 (+) Transcript_63968:190-1908(+)
MIEYERTRWGIRSIIHYRGSRIPQALMWAVPSALAASLLHVLLHRSGNVESIAAADLSAQVVGGYSAVLGFLVFFRAQKAYSRWWEGGTLLQQLRGEWFNAYSSLLAFSSSDADKREQVEKFEHLLVRLMSMLYCSALQQVSSPKCCGGLGGMSFEVIDFDGMDKESLQFLECCSDKCEVVLQWIQRLIVENINNGVLPIAPPILSRVFQEFSRGIVNLNNARKIAEFPFPFPLVQLITVLLVIQTVLIPSVCISALVSPVWAGLVTFLILFCFWCVHYTAEEMEMPFGNNDNDLPLEDMQADMNQSLKTLLERRAQLPPAFKYRAHIHGQCRATVMSVMSGSTRSSSRSMSVCSHLDVQLGCSKADTADDKDEVDTCCCVLVRDKTDREGEPKTIEEARKSLNLLHEQLKVPGRLSLGSEDAQRHRQGLAERHKQALKLAHREPETVDYEVATESKGHRAAQMLVIPHRKLRESRIHAAGPSEALSPVLSVDEEAASSTSSRCSPSSVTNLLRVNEAPASPPPVEGRRNSFQQTSAVDEEGREALARVELSWGHAVLQLMGLLHSLFRQRR